MSKSLTIDELKGSFTPSKVVIEVNSLETALALKAFGLMLSSNIGGWSLDLFRHAENHGLLKYVGKKGGSYYHKKDPFTNECSKTLRSLSDIFKTDLVKETR